MTQVGFPAHSRASAWLLMNAMVPLPEAAGSLRVAIKALTSGFGRYPMVSARRWIFWRRSKEIRGWLLSARETVDCETRARKATSDMEIF